MSSEITALAPSAGVLRLVSSRFVASRWNSQPVEPTCGGPCVELTTPTGLVTPRAVWAGCSRALTVYDGDDAMRWEVQPDEPPRDR